MLIADLHIHSCYSRATSRECTPEHLELWARKKGIQLLGTGDFTHPAWRAALREKLIPAEDGLYLLREEFRQTDATVGAPSAPRFLVTGEISSIYKKNGRTRKVHHLILLPSLEAAETLSLRLEAIGNLHSDGRPILGLDSRNLLEITLDVCPEAILIPAHIWTPHFSMFGAFSGFDTIEECFEDLSPQIHAFETGLSSDPPMNWRLSALDRLTMISNSDAHSPQKLGREANLLQTECSYPAIRRAIQGENPSGFYGTIEFFPEEGKYHYDGHRNCKVCLTPSETIRAGGRCPVCGGKLTVGVLHRVKALADRPEGAVPSDARPYESLIPLPEVIAASTGFTPASTKVQTCYERLLQTLGSEFFILREASLSDIRLAAGPCIAEGIRRMRAGEINMEPGYDGEYGKLHLLDASEISSLSGQLSLFGVATPVKPKKGVTASPLSHKASTPPDDVGSEEAKNSFPSMCSSLNHEQQAAVCAQEACVMVSAGPGTGKTKTLVSRILFLLENGVAPSEITAVTFTNKAAHEMRERLSRALNRRTANAVTVGTFHAICLTLLKESGLSPSIVSEQDASVLADETIRAFALPLSSRQFLERVSKIKNGIDGTDEALLTPDVLKDYQERLCLAGGMDFDDLLLEALRRKPDAAGRRFTQLLVDEFQDINYVQFQLIQQWSQHSAGLFVIGDPDQSIYGFRGADPSCFSRLREIFPEARQITLLQNYRSSPQILRFASAAIAANRGERASLQPQRPNGPDVKLLTAPDHFSEALFLAKEINRMVGGIDMLDAQNSRSTRARGFSEIACLYRTHRQAELLEKCFRKEGIPYTVTGRDTLLSDPYVRGTVAFFRAVLFPDDRASRRTALRLLMPDIAALPPSDVSAQWEILSGQYAATVKKHKPHVVLDTWMADRELRSMEAMEKLRNMSVFYPRMEDFLQNLTLGTESDLTRSGSKTYRTDSVSLMTLHAAKGLEFPVVFLCGLERDVLPLTMYKSADIEEERRLFYVGITRAQEELFLLTSPTPSPFLSEIPTSLLQKGIAIESRRTTGQQLRLF